MDIKRNDRNRIVIPVWGFTKAGGSRVLANWVNEWTQIGVDVIMICFFKSIAPYYPVKGKILFFNEQGEFVDREDEDKGENGTISRAQLLLSMHKGTLKALNALSEEYNTVIANYSLTAFSVSKCKIQNKYYYIQAYEAWEQSNSHSIARTILNLVVRRTYSLPLTKVVNAEIYRDYKEIHSEYVVPPGLDLNIYYPKSSFWDQQKPITVGCIGRTELWKGSEDVAIAVDLLQRDGFDIKFLVAFNPPQHAKFELVKPDGDKNLAEFYRRCDILVAPGTIQLGAIHYPVIEAMAVKTPVITTGYYPADKENAYIVPVSAPQKIAETIKYISNNYDEAMGKAEAAYNTIQEFSWSKTACKMLNIINETSREK